MGATYRPPQKLYPFESHWLNLGGNCLHYLDEGPRDAPPVLMLHGNPTWSFYYRRLILALRDRYRCIVPDHIGCGLSDKPGDDRYEYRLRERVNDLAALMTHLGLSRPISLVVHDWGGMIGFAWATEHPDRIASCVILNTAAFRMPAGKGLPRALWLARTPPGALLIRSCNAFAAIAARVALRKPVSREIRAAYTGPYDSWDHRIATLRFVQDIPLSVNDPSWLILARTEDRLHRLAGKPALLAWGMQDFVFDHHFLRRWEAVLPNAEVLPLDDCGHYVLEDGGPELIDRIAAYLDRHEHAG